MNKKTLTLVVSLVIILALGIGVYFLFFTETQDSQTTQQETQEEPIEKDGDAQEVINLVAVGPIKGDGSGTATRRIINGKFIHTVQAEIPDPSAGKFYEGWLVSGSNFFSTGKMVKRGDYWELEYTVNEDKNNYPEVVITEETKANGLDEIPETHILEGSFNE